MARQSSARASGPRPERRDGYWTRRARAVIDETTRAWLRERGCRRTALKDLPEREQGELLRVVRAAYPFGERAGWPYTVWLREVRDWRRQTGPPPPLSAPATYGEYQAREAGGQTRLELL